MSKADIDYICFMRLTKNKNKTLRELLLYGVFSIIVFLFYSFDKNRPLIELYGIAFFLNYLIASLIISYFLFPRYVYRKKNVQFVVSLVILITVVILVEELVIEKYFFPDTRGKYFQNLIFNLIDVVPPIIILSGFKLARDATTKQRQLDELKVVAQENELQFLKSQINPHFLFNNMNNLYAHAVENSSKTPEIILALSSILRYMLYECKVKYVSLEKEIEQLENFIQLGELQIEGRGIVCFNNEIDVTGYQIAPLMLMVFVENAFKHSSSSVVDNISIVIKLKIDEGGMLKFSCVNSFRRESNKESLSDGIGLINVNKRLDLMYPGAYDLSIKDSENLYQVHLSLQLKKLA